MRALRSGTVELSAFSRLQAQSAALRAATNRQFRAAGLTSCISAP
jgi:hypothetical protein